MRRPRQLAVLFGCFLLALAPAVLWLGNPVAQAADPVSFVGAAHSGPEKDLVKSVAIPPTSSVGDRAVLVFTRAKSVSWSGPTGVSGWTQVASSTANTLTTLVWEKTLTSGDAGSTVSFDTTTSAKAMLSIAVYHGVAPGPIAATAGSDASTTSHLTPAVTAASGDWVMSYWVDRSDTTGSWTASGVTTRDVAIGTGTNRYGSLLADSGGPVAAGTYAAKTGTTNVATSALMWSIVLPGGVPPANSPPVARFNVTCHQLTCDVDGSTSSDSDGTVDDYSWDFDDGTGGSGALNSRTYAAAGIYNITLTVTDDDLATGSVTHQVTVSGNSSSISFVGASHSAPTQQTVKSATVPASATAGDVAVIVFTRAKSVSWTGPSGVTGWTAVGNATANSLTSGVWTKTLTAGDAGSTVSFSTGTAAKAMLSVAVYRGVAAGSVVAVPGSDTMTTSHVAASATTAAGDWVASYWVDRSDTTGSWTPVSLADRDVAIGTGSNRYSSLLADSAGPVPGGTYGGATATTDVATSSSMWSIVLPGGAAEPPQVTKLMVIMEENETTSAYDGMPYLRSLSNTYGKATSYRGQTHPSLGNYIAIVSGQGVDTCGLNNNPLPSVCPQPGRTVFGQALSFGKSAKSYAESMPANCRRTNVSPYVVRHNPWPYFTDETGDCNGLDVPLGTPASGALRSDIDAGTVPHASMVIPNLNNDAHDGSLQQADDWLAGWIPTIMAGPDFQAGQLAIVVTFDEGIGANQNIPFVVVHPTLSGKVVTQAFDHYGLTRMYDDVLGVPPLNLAATHPGLKAAFGL